MRLINNPPESQILTIWQHLLLDRTELTTEGGEPIKVIYPGRTNDDRGADFRDAVIATSRGLAKGDIEVHVKSSDWRTHHHHNDPAYNRVILHVVMWNDIGKATNLQNGKTIPTLALYKYPISQQTNLARPPSSLSIPCLRAAERLTPGIMAEVLDTAGKERFLAKATRFQVDLGQMEAGQCLYQGIMGALGYSKNKLPFLELASRLPLPLLESTTQDKISDEECLTRQQALLLGTAGLLPSQRPNWHQGNELDDDWVDRLERLWASYCQPKAMPSDDWCLFKVRPNNFPVRRIVAMSYLILRYKGKGILEGVVNMVKEIAVSKDHYRLEEGLLVTTNGYWANHFDFGSSSRIRAPTLLGRRRAADIVLNVLLPFIFAWSRLTSRPELERKAFELYSSYPKLVVNTVERHMREQLGLSNYPVDSAQRQQGLIHIYNTLCTQGKCNSCPLGQDLPSIYGKLYTGFQPGS